jgi:hypothetical protein
LAAILVPGLSTLDAENYGFGILPSVGGGWLLASALHWLAARGKHPAGRRTLEKTRAVVLFGIGCAVLEAGWFIAQVPTTRFLGFLTPVFTGAGVGFIWLRYAHATSPRDDSWKTPGSIRLPARLPRGVYQQAEGFLVLLVSLIVGLIRIVPESANADVILVPIGVGVTVALLLTLWVFRGQSPETGGR